MDTRSFIDSGILQDYALGIASEQDRRAVQCLSGIYPEIKEALVQAERDLEQFAGAYAVKAPSSLRESVMAGVRNHGQIKQVASPAEAPDKAGRVVQMNQPIAASKTTLVWPWAAAASVCLGFAIWQYSINGARTSEINRLSVESESLRTNIDSLRSSLHVAQNSFGEVFDPNMKKVVLNSTVAEKSLQLSLFWNTSTGEVQIDPAALPELAEGLQYQLWVLIDGVPQDMGVIPIDASEVLIASQSATGGQAFAITIEKLGGSPTPSLDQLILLGNVV